MRRWVLTLLLVLSAVPGWAQTPPAIRQAEVEFIASCREAGGRGYLGAGFATAVDLTGDGRLDYILDGNRVECTVQPMTCGSAGCYSEIHVWTPGGYRRAFGANVRGLRIDRSTQPATVLLDLHGMHCNRVGAAACVQVLAWNGHNFALAGARVRPPELPAERWGIRRVGERLMAYAPGQGPLREMSFTCEKNRAFIAIALRSAQPVSDAVLTASIDGRKFDAIVSSAPAHPTIHIADITTTGLVQAMADARGPIALTLNGTSLGTVTPNGSAAQLRAALGACLPM